MPTQYLQLNWQLQFYHSYWVWIFKKISLITFMIIIRCWILFVFLFVVMLLVFVFGYFQKLNIIHIFIQSFFKSWILSFFVFSPENTIRSSLKTIALGFYHLYTSPDFEPVYQLLWTKETNKKVWNGPKLTKLTKMVQCSPIWFRVVQNRDVQNAKRLGLTMFCSLLDTTEVFKRLRIWQNVF